MTIQLGSRMYLSVFIMICLALAPASAEQLDIAPFARTLSWDARALEGTKASRSDEFPLADLAPYKELLPAKDGSYEAPSSDGTGCIGLQWWEDRLLRRVEIVLADSPTSPAPAVQLQVWTGESVWQGKWQAVKAAAVAEGNQLSWTLDEQEIPLGTPKVRWLFRGVSKPITVKRISAFTRSASRTVAVRIQRAQPDTAKPADIEIYNGAVDPQGVITYHTSWDGQTPLVLNIRAAVPQAYKADRTVLRFTFPDTAFGVAIEDLLTNDCVYVPHAGLFVTRDPPPVTPDDYRTRIAAQSTMLEQVRRQPDQLFQRSFDTLHSPRQDTLPYANTLISLAGDNRKFLVERSGHVIFNEFSAPDDYPGASDGVHTVAANVNQWRFAPRFGGKDLPIARHLRGGWLPMPVNVATDGAITYQQMTYVAPIGDAPPDGPTWLRDQALCAVEFDIRNTGQGPAEAALSLQFVPEQVPQPAVRQEPVPEGLLLVNHDRLLACVTTTPAAPLTAHSDPSGLTLAGTLPGRSTAHCTVYLPGWNCAPAAYPAILKGEPWAARVEPYWNAVLAPGMQIDIPDPTLNNLIRASQVHCLIAARNEKRGQLVVPWISSVHFGYPESEANSVIRGLDITGHADFAQRALDFYLSRCNSAGYITIIVANICGYTIVGTGEVLWTLGEHYQRTRDRVWLKRVAPEVARICQWLIRQREKTKRLDARGDKSPEYGLFPPGVSADWGRFAYRLFNDAQYYRGLLNAGQALADINDSAAPAILADTRQYRDDILRAYHYMQARSPVVPLRNGTWLPADPAILGCFGHVEDFLPSANAPNYCYSVELGASHLVVHEILDPRSREADWMVNYLEDVQFFRPNYADPAAKRDLVTFGGFAKMQPYYCRIAEIHAQRDDVKPFIRSYLNPIAALVNFENLTFWEDWNGGQTGGAWNKTHETGWFLSQTRTMLVTERGDELWLAPFVTNQWLKDGMKIAVRNAPTRFGRVGFTITSQVGEGRIKAVVELPRACTARKVVLRLRHPEAKPIRSITVQGRPHRDFDPVQETLTLVPAGETLAIEAEYR